MKFRQFDSLRLFCLVAGHGSFSAAAQALNLTKGAISQQIKGLEETLGFALFVRRPRGITLTPKGQDLLVSAQNTFFRLEQDIARLRQDQSNSITIGLSTYLASRWLSPRLMLFMKHHTGLRLRLQPLVDLTNLQDEGVDLAIRWGRGDWNDLIIEPLFACPAFPTGSAAAGELVRQKGPDAAFAELTLLKDREGSHAWADWYAVAGLPYRERADTLTVPDPNVRVQAVIDGQGVALNDALVSAELERGQLVRLSEHQLDDYGYFLAYPPGTMDQPHLATFANWLMEQGL
ncbi:MAG: LysR substrate-binding domain-containing protein [Pseudomonadota bacterium]